MAGEPSTVLIDGGIVMPMDGTKTVHDPGSVLVVDGMIVAVGAVDEVARHPAAATAPRVDASLHAVIPGLHNGHLHSGLLRGTAESMALWEWLENHIDPAHRALTPNIARAASYMAYTEALRGGTTSVLDMWRFMEGSAEAAEEVGIRATLAPYGADRYDYFESLESNRRLLESHLVAADGRVRTWVGLEHIFYCSPEMFRGAAELAEEFGTGIHTHSSESIWEVEECLRQHGRRPIEEMYQRGILGPSTVIAHAVWLDDREVEVLAQTGTAMTHCPCSNMKLSSGAARIGHYRDRGVVCALGTDGEKENNNLDMLEEMKFASLLQKVSTLDPTTGDPWDILDMATRSGARGARPRRRHRFAGGRQGRRRGDRGPARPALRPPAARRRLQRCRPPRLHRQQPRRPRRVGAWPPRRGRRRRDDRRCRRGRRRGAGRRGGALRPPPSPPGPHPESGHRPRQTGAMIALMGDPVLADSWLPVTNSRDVDTARPRGFTLLDTPIVLWRSLDGTVHAARDQCPHRGAALSLGHVRGDTLQCPYHGWVYDGGGRCVCQPAMPGRTPPPNARLDMFSASERYGVVFVALGSPPSERPAYFPEWDEHGVRHYHDDPVVVHACGPRIVENFLDMAHFPFVHPGVLGTESHAEVRDYTVTATADGIELTDCWFWQPAATPGSTGGADVEYRYRVPHPYVAALTKVPADGAFGFSLMIMASPVDEEHCRAWMIGAFTDPDVSTEDFCAFNHRIFLQDIPILESQRPRSPPARPDRRAGAARRPCLVRLPPLADGPRRSRTAPSPERSRHHE